MTRQAIRQDLELAKMLPEGPDREAMLVVASDRAARYAHRELGPDALNSRQRALLYGSTAVGVGVFVGLASLNEHVDLMPPIAMLLLSLEISSVGCAGAGVTLIALDLHHGARVERAAVVASELPLRAQRRRNLARQSALDEQ